MKKIIKFILILGLIGLVALGVIKGKEYYENRYVGTSYYAMVPADESTEVEPIYDDSGDEMGKGRNYALKSYNGKEERILEFTVYKDKPEELLQPGTFMKIEASKQIVTGEKIITREEVPENILKIIEKNK